MIIYTASQQSYADSVVDFIDPTKSLFKYRLYRHNCVEVKNPDFPDKTLYIKDLRIIKNIPLENMVIIDNSVLSFAFHLENGIPILPFYSNKEDIEMNNLKDYLNSLAHLDNLASNNGAALNLRGLLEEAVKESENDTENVDIETKDNSSNTSTTNTPITNKKDPINKNGKLESKSLKSINAKNTDPKKVSFNNKQSSNATSKDNKASNSISINDNLKNSESNEKKLRAPIRRKSNIETLIKQTMNYKK